MLSSIGKFSKSLFIKVLVGIIILPFVFWGMGDVFRGGNQNIVATIDSKKISAQEFANFINRLNLSDQERKNIGNSKLLERILSEYIGRKIIKLEIEDLSIKLTDSTLRDIIINDKTFFKDNKFSRTAYEKFLIQSSITAPQFEINIAEQEKKRQLLSFLSAGITIPEFLIKDEFNKLNQIKTIKYIDLKNFYLNRKPKQKEIEEIYKKNKKFFTEEFKNINFVELKPKNLVGKTEADEIFFKEIDTIENNIIDGKSVIDISNSYNLVPQKLLEVNSKKQDSNGKELQDIKDNLYNKIFILQNNGSASLINLDNKFYVAEIISIIKKDKPLNDKDVLNAIKNQIKLKDKVENNTEIVRQISNGSFNQIEMEKFAQKNKLEIVDAVITSTKENKVFTENVIKRIFETKKKEINLITDSMLSENYIILTEDTQYKNFQKESEEYMNYKKIAKMNLSNEIYKVYDESINSKYNVEVNNKTLDRIKNSF